MSNSPLFVALDVSLNESKICAVDEQGTIVFEMVAPSDPDAIATVLRHNPSGRDIGIVGLEAGPLAPWLHGGLRQAGFHAVCLETRRIKAGLKAQRNKTDKTDARGIAQMLRMGWYTEVHVKGDDSQELRVLLTNRATLKRRWRDLENEIRGTLKAFGIELGRVTRLSFAVRVRDALQGRPSLLAMVEPMLAVRETMMQQFAILHRMVLDTVRTDPLCRRLMTTPGVGAVVALTFKTGVDDPRRFAQSKAVGAHFGLTPRKYQSGERDHAGHISKCGDAGVRCALYEAAHILLTRYAKDLPLKRWALAIAKRSGLQQAKVALARKLAVILHRMWMDGTVFTADRTEAAAA